MYKQQHNITLVKGDTLNFDLDMSYGSWDALDITGYIFRLGIYISEDQIYRKEVSSHDDPVNGQAGDLKFTPEETKDMPVGTYKYDIEMQNASGDVYTFVQGNIVINEWFAWSVTI